MSEPKPPLRTSSPGTELASPLRNFLRSAVDEHAVRRMWQGIDRRTAPRGSRARSTRFWLQLAAAVLVWVVGGAWLGSGERWRALSRAPAVALRQADGQRFERLESALGEGVREVALGDGSRIEAWPGARIEGLASTPSEFVLVVRRGRVRFSVTPGGPRRWQIEARGARVEVVGTVLSVESSDERVRVAVEEGAVLVRSPALSDGVQRVEAGDVLEIELPRASAADAPEGAVVGAAAEQLPALDVSELPEQPPPARREGPRRLPELEDPARDAHARAVARELWAQADSARLAGQASLAADLLEQLVGNHPGDPQAALAAFTLGTLQKAELHRPEAAARAFRRALDLGIAAALRDTCYARLAEALREVGDEATLRAVVREYVEKYPEGEARPALERLQSEGRRPAPSGSTAE